MKTFYEIACMVIKIFGHLSISTGTEYFTYQDHNNTAELHTSHTSRTSMGHQYTTCHDTLSMGYINYFRIILILTFNKKFITQTF
jgi:hypothetical protein